MFGTGHEDKDVGLSGEKLAMARESIQNKQPQPPSVLYHRISRVDWIGERIRLSAQPLAVGIATMSQHDMRRRRSASRGMEESEMHVACNGR